MAAFFIVDIEVLDPAGYEKYRDLVPPTVAAFGGKYLTRGGKVEPLEGEWMPKRFVILEFPSVAQFKTWYNSPEYQALLPIRMKTTTSRAFVIEGV
jgi:uncharacterized protein (DUF1330 family)